MNDLKNLRSIKDVNNVIIDSLDKKKLISDVKKIFLAFTKVEYKPYIREFVDKNIDNILTYENEFFCDYKDYIRIKVLLKISNIDELWSLPAEAFKKKYSIHYFEPRNYIDIEERTFSFYKNQYSSSFLIEIPKRDEYDFLISVYKLRSKILRSLT